MANVPSFEDLRGLLQSGSVKIVPKKVAADPNQSYSEGVVDANGQVTQYVGTINGQEIPLSNDTAFIPQYKQKTVTQGEGNDAYQVQRDDMSQPPIGFRLRARSSENTGLFNDVNLGYDPQTGTVPPPKASDYYTSGSRDSSTFQNVLPVALAALGGFGGLFGGAGEIGLGATDASLGAAGAVNAAAGAGAGAGAGALTTSGTGAGALTTAGTGGAGAAGVGAGGAGVGAGGIAKGVLGAAGSVLGGGGGGLGLNPNLISGGIGTVGGLLQSQTSKDAAIKAKQDILAATNTGVTSSTFKPVGVTTAFGTSNFTTDPITGQLTGAGYTPSSAISKGVSSLTSLGQKYLTQSPEDVAAQYMLSQQSLLAPSRERQLAGIKNQLYNSGRTGLSIGGTGLRPGGGLGLSAANPELESYYNAIAQQDLQLASQAQTAGQQNVNFGANLFTQAGGLEQLAQQPLSFSSQLGGLSANYGGNAGRLGLTGTLAGANFGTGSAATNNPYASVLTGLGSPTSTLGTGFTNLLGNYLNSGQLNTNDINLINNLYGGSTNYSGGSGGYA
jgi:hypothetical protein